MKTRTAELLNTQINKELHSAYLYFEMSRYYEDLGLKGFANWFFVQAQEECDHAMLFFRFMQNNGLKVTLKALDAPEDDYEGVLEPLTAALEQEKLVTELIHNIFKVAMDDNDFRTMQFLNWFIDEQAEEEMNARDLISKIECFGEEGEVLYHIDKELGERVYESPTLELP